jgi:hypothetical protein
VRNEELEDAIEVTITCQQARNLIDDVELQVLAEAIDIAQAKVFGDMVDQSILIIRIKKGD